MCWSYLGTILTIKVEMTYNSLDNLIVKFEKTLDVNKISYVLFMYYNILYFYRFLSPNKKNLTLI